MSMGSFLEEIQKKSKERRITVGRKFICAEQLQYNAKKLLNESNASAVFADSQTSIHADSTIGQDNSIAAEMSLLSPNARALARMPEEERRRIAWERFQEHLRKQKRIHEIERIVKEKNSHLSAAELARKLEAQLEKEIAEERASEAKAMELASNDSGMDEQMKNAGEQSVQPMEVDESTFRVPSSSASASPAPSALSAARLPHLQIAHSTPLVASRKPQFGPINVSSILVANNSNAEFRFPPQIFLIIQLNFDLLKLNSASTLFDTIQKTIQMQNFPTQNSYRSQPMTQPSRWK
ncbi:hypothetical protein WR25_02616 [Diploscapter pachys]|uniref:Uncharacterized protein n=1 Tax=Diploscapter pachys TaxID=2018661 RepID=A0A2A2LV99_9BILA|nr:hypothetical protein WR25_02616 [Diploscapter pachys]